MFINRTGHYGKCMQLSAADEAFWNTRLKLRSINFSAARSGAHNSVPRPTTSKRIVFNFFCTSHFVSSFLSSSVCVCACVCLCLSVHVHVCAFLLILCLLFANGLPHVPRAWQTWSVGCQMRSVQGSLRYEYSFEPHSGHS